MENEERAVAILFLVFAAIILAIAVLVLCQKTPLPEKPAGKSGKKQGRNSKARQTGIIFLFVGLILAAMALSMWTDLLGFRIAEIVLIVAGVFYTGRSSGFFRLKK